MPGSASYREAHPLPYVLTHWAHLLSMVALAFTGFYIHDPFFRVDMTLMRQLHFVSMYVLLIALAARVWLALTGSSTTAKGTRERRRDVLNFLPQAENRGQLAETARYYVFLRKTHPPSAKYNPLQKSAYLVMGGMLLVQAYTGLAIYGPAQAGILGEVLGFGAALAGGLMAMRTIHHFLLWALIAVTLVHAYLAVAEDAASIPLMFAWRETAEPSLAGESLADAPDDPDAVESLPGEQLTLGA